MKGLKLKLFFILALVLGMNFALAFGINIPITSQSPTAFSCVRLLSYCSQIGNELCSIGTNLFKSSDSFATFETPRAVIRPQKLDDAYALTKILTDQQNQQMSGDHITIGDVLYSASRVPPTRGHRWRQIHFSILSKETGEVIGYLHMTKVSASAKPENMNQFMKNGSGPKDDEAVSGWATIGYSLARSAWGSGIMTEVVQSAIEYGQTELGVTHFFAETLNENIGSQRVLEKAGFKKIGQTPRETYFELPVAEQRQQGHGA